LLVPSLLKRVRSDDIARHLGAKHEGRAAYVIAEEGVSLSRLPCFAAMAAG
jgi:hypothetical protein